MSALDPVNLLRIAGTSVLALAVVHSVTFAIGRLVAWSTSAP